MRSPIAAAGAFWSSLLLMALAIGLALRALNFAIPGRVENTVVGNLVLSWGGAYFLLTHSPNPGWLPWAVALGCLTHIAGDALTTAGIPVPLVWIAHRCRLKLLPIRTGNVVEKAILVPLFLFATALCIYLNTEAHTALDRWSSGSSASADPVAQDGARPADSGGGTPLREAAELGQHPRAGTRRRPRRRLDADRVPAPRPHARRAPR